MSADATAAVEPGNGPTHAAPRARPVWAWLLAVVVGAAALLAFLSLGVGASLEPATFGLLAAAGVLLWCLRRLLRMVQALTRTGVDAVVDRGDVIAQAGERRAREERRRVLRAIKELDFDHAMGKISDADHREIRSAYQMRAVEVGRALEQGPALHPELAELLAAEGTGEEGGDAPPAETGTEHASAEPPEAESSAVTCGACGGDNDGDAKFCKHCGAALGR